MQALTIILTEQRLAIYLNLISLSIEVTSLAFSTHGPSYDNEMRVLVGMWVGGYVAAYV
jgi:hypothetical protein